MHKILNKEKIIIPKANNLKQRYDAQDMNQTFIIMILHHYFAERSPAG